MNKRLVIHGLAVAATVGAAGFFFSQSGWIGAGQRSETLEELRQLKQHDAALNQEALNVRAGLVQHYDPLVKATHRVADVVVGLQDSRRGIVGRGDQDIDQLVKKYAQLYDKRITMVERFKARNSTLRNSLFYFPTAAALLIKHAQEDGAPRALIETTERMLQSVLSFYVNGNPEIQARVQADLHELSRLSDEAPSGLGREITGLMKHAGIVLHHKRQVDDMLAQITSPESLSVLDSLVHVYESKQLAARTGAELYRAGFYVTVTGLVCYVLFLVAARRRQDPDDEDWHGSVRNRIVVAANRAA